MLVVPTTKGGIMEDELKKAIAFHRAAFPGSAVFIREDRQEALIIADDGHYIISVTPDGSTNSATIDENGWETGYNA